MRSFFMIAFVVSGCVHTSTVPSPADTGGGSPAVPVDAQGYPKLPPVVVKEMAPPMVEVQAPRETTEVPCGNDLVIKVDKLDVNMPKGGSLEIGGVKWDTSAYHIVMENASFSNIHHCLQ